MNGKQLQSGPIHSLHVLIYTRGRRAILLQGTPMDAGEIDIQHGALTS
jgi:hypothetical protein